ncbi:BLOC-2 complex member HPS6 [Pelobates fuscus]|uniref:BLOC-2 complex member HPS6 n=1 Tax=Pelobates fuscus TaxID=191477 RepID=UPI002FE46C77
MAPFGAPELLCDLSAWGRPEALREALEGGGYRALCSPDGGHLLLLLPDQRRLLSFPRLAGPPHSPHLELSWPGRSPPPLALLFPRSEPGWALAVVWESGRTELWRPPPARSPEGWACLQSLELCSSPRARVASACLSGGDLVWCEERPPSEATPSARSRPYRYCICVRPLGTAGTVRVLLHHIPPCQLYTGSQHIFMVPDGSTRGIAAQLLMVYSRLEERVTLASRSRGFIHSKSLSEGECDFQRMVVEYLGSMASQGHMATWCCATTGTEELLLMDASGQIYLLCPDGAVRRVYNFKNQDVCDKQIAMQVFGGTLACVLDTALHLIDLHTGRLIEKKILSADGLVFLKVFKTEAVQFLTKTGVYTIGISSGPAGNAESYEKLEPALLEMIFEESCKYYQKRSLNSTKLTVHSFKQEGIFQAPITLLTILKHLQKKENFMDEKYADLLSAMNNELQNYLSLEILKPCIINAAENEMETCCEDLVGKEIDRLLHTDLDRENLVYINSLFSMFPKASWVSIRHNLQFQQNGDGKLVVRATADLWKKVLGPLPTGSKEQNGVHPLFEMICQSLYKFKPKWLPGFVKLAQDCSGLSWGYSNKDNCESVPLYKRALSILGKQKANTTIDRELEIDILLFSGRPLAIIQAIHVLIGLQRWERVIKETKKFSELSSVITKDIFITLLVEFVKHRHLDPYINQLCEICPDDITSTDVLRIVLQNLPKSGVCSPFSCDQSSSLTIGLLKPLLNKVLQNQINVAKNAGTPTFPPSTPHRTDPS